MANSSSAPRYDAPPATQPQPASDALLTDVDVVAAFHAMLKDALAQARAENLIDDEMLEQANVDVQINGPALCLCFAALQAAGSPPAIRAPDGSFILDNANCPPSFRVFFQSWQAEVLPIQRLPIDLRHDLIRLICDNEPLHPQQVADHPDVPRIVATLKSISINLLQRRTFQLLFSDDLQHALDSSVRPRSPHPPGSPTASRRSGESARSNLTDGPERVHQYQPPPGYEPLPPTSNVPGVTSQPAPSQPQAPPVPPEKTPLPNRPAPPVAPQSRPVPPPPSSAASRTGSLNVPGATGAAADSSSSLPSDDPNLQLIRETLLSALADVLATTPSIRLLLSRGSEWASHAYFACLCLAILEVALHRVTPSGGVKCVQLGSGPPKIIGMGDCPLQLRKLLWALSNIGAKVQLLAQDDDLAAMRLAEGSFDETPAQEQQQGPAAAGAEGRRNGPLRGGAPPHHQQQQHRPSSSVDNTTNRIDRLRYRLENGVDRDIAAPVNTPARTPGSGSLRLQTNVTEVSNNINQLALALFKIPTFRERQREAFKVLQSIETL
ncbi:hypothetical protein OC845_003990 [Tilletia horrida]|nr:hypothetical protein OC845_003990 [Tilletia horrida]